MPPPTILIIGATGNTAIGVLELLPSLLASSNTLQSHRILAVTRSLSSTIAQQRSQLPGITLIEQNWVEIDSAWLKSHSITRIFIAPHIDPTAFVEESQLYVNALQAGVEYVVRVGTTAGNAKADSIVYHARAHWALENLLSQPEFGRMGWTSLRPNCFNGMFLYSAVEFVRGFGEKEGKKGGVLSLPLAKDVGVGLMDARDVGVFAAYLLAEEDPSRHHGRKYDISGPDDVTGEEIVRWVEECIGEEVKEVKFQDTSLIDHVAAQSDYSKNIMMSIREALHIAWNGECSTSLISKDVLKIAPPKGRAKDAFKAMLERPS